MHREKLTGGRSSDPAIYQYLGLTPSKTKPQGVTLVSWTLYNQNGEAVYSFTPIAIVPGRPQPSEAS